MSKHTPGPWKMQRASWHGTPVEGHIGVSVAWCGCATTASKDGCYSIDASEAEANARLIAAAPDMADALRMWARWDDMTQLDLALALEATNAALAKAGVA